MEKLIFFLKMLLFWATKLLQLCLTEKPYYRICGPKYWPRTGTWYNYAQKYCISIPQLSKVFSYLLIYYFLSQSIKSKKIVSHKYRKKRFVLQKKVNRQIKMMTSFELTTSRGPLYIFALWWTITKYNW